jgi:hypothetical protein
MHELQSEKCGSTTDSINTLCCKMYKYNDLRTQLLSYTHITSKVLLLSLKLHEHYCALMEYVSLACVTEFVSCNCPHSLLYCFA